LRELLSIPTAEDKEALPAVVETPQVDGAEESDTEPGVLANVEEAAPLLQILDEDSPCTASYEPGIRGLAGVVACRTHARHPELSLGGQLTAIPAWVQHFAKKGALQPSDDFYMACKQMEDIFQKTHSTSVSFKFGLLDAFQKQVAHANVNAPISAIKLFGWLRLCARLRCLNQRKNKNQGAVLSVMAAAKKSKNTRAGKTRNIWAK
jgi:hypothetical protein